MLNWGWNRLSLIIFVWMQQKWKFLFRFNEQWNDNFQFSNRCWPLNRVLVIWTKRNWTKLSSVQSVLLIFVHFSQILKLALYEPGASFFVVLKQFRYSSLVYSLRVSHSARVAACAFPRELQIACHAANDPLLQLHPEKLFSSRSIPVC